MSQGFLTFSLVPSLSPTHPVTAQSFQQERTEALMERTHNSRHIWGMHCAFFHTVCQEFSLCPSETPPPPNSLQDNRRMTGFSVPCFSKSPSHPHVTHKTQDKSNSMLKLNRWSQTVDTLFKIRHPFKQGGKRAKEIECVLNLPTYSTVLRTSDAFIQKCLYVFILDLPCDTMCPARWGLNFLCTLSSSRCTNYSK